MKNERQFSARITSQTERSSSQPIIHNGKDKTTNRTPTWINLYSTSREGGGRLRRPWSDLFDLGVLMTLTLVTSSPPYGLDLVFTLQTISRPGVFRPRLLSFIYLRCSAEKDMVCITRLLTYNHKQLDVFEKNACLPHPARSSLRAVEGRQRTRYDRFETEAFIKVRRTCTYIYEHQ